MKRDLLIAKILLTIGVLEFFGPLLKDTGTSHLMNAEWVGHAKLHLAWLLGYMFFSGLANLYFIWIRRPFKLSHLYLSCLWQATNIAGFWAAILFVPVYEGAIVDHRYHTEILGIDENIFGFLALSLVLAGAFFWTKFKVEPHFNRSAPTA
ncbi:MAG: hypothetical protein KDD19_06425 [Phaeodactylibacter sp.]|nr:hypothetical protein [Phaeodactylibacter sp.]MCB9051657.1 hypothetical protein [Lewinellaceae bacterium]